MNSSCPFCQIPKERIWLESKHSLVLLDGFPVAEGHSLVIPKRHVQSVFELPEAELGDLWLAVARARAVLKQKYGPDGFNVGINDGTAAGQTVPHAHVHVIPRQAGNVPDARGGIRWIFPAKAKYW